MSDRGYYVNQLSSIISLGIGTDRASNRYCERLSDTAFLEIFEDAKACPSERAEAGEADGTH